MPTPRDPGELLRVARLYHVDGRSQAEVARIVGTGRSNVSRMLAEAQRLGIVEIRLHDPAGRVPELEDRLRAAFGIADARVASRSTAGRVDDRVGALAARLLLESVKDAMTVALSWGGALQATVDAVTTERDHDLTLVQLIGGMAAVSHDVSGQELVRQLAVRLGASYRLLHAPATLESAASRDALLAEPTIAGVLDLARGADLALVGIGTPTLGSSAAVVAGMNLSPADEQAFWAAGPVGDLAGRFFDRDGHAVSGPVDDRVVAVSLADLDGVPEVIGVAVGRAKTDAALGALRGRHLDSLVCDESLARSLLSEVGPAR
jgi:DNA-binding transcriptional regulator LsrR (DeoR family)